MISRSPVDPLLLCAGAVNPNISCFVTHPCFSFLCARALNTLLRRSRPALPAPFFYAQGRSIRTFRLFLRTPVSHSCAPARSIRDFMLDYVTTPRSDLACPPSVSVRRGGQYKHFVFLGFCGHPWLLQSCPHGPYRGPLGVLNCSPGRPESLIWCLPGPTGCSM